MKLKTGIFTLLTGVIVSISIVGCEKKTKDTTPTAETDNDVTSASDNNLADAAFNDVQNITDQASKGSLVFFSPINNGGKNSNNGTEKSSCATITHDSLSNPKTIVIDFGTSNCLCNDGKNRRGKINVSYSGHYRDSASVHTVTFTDYYVNDNQLLGTKTVTNNGHNSNGNLSFTIHVDGQVIKANGGGTITWVSDRVREWLVGENTLTWADDVYSITGTTTATKANGNSFTSVITTPLHRALNCHWFDSGVIEITPSNKPVRIVNYGAGSCDADATVTINGITYPFVMN